MEAIKANARIGPDHKLTWLEPMSPLLEGQVEVILLYPQEIEQASNPPVADWPVLNGGRYLGGTLRREEIYDDAR
jgi:hypothetical protein